MTARLFTVGRAIADLADSLNANEGGRAATPPETDGLDGCPNGSRLAAMRVNYNLRFLPCQSETGEEKIDLRLHNCEVVLGATLQNEARTQRSEVRNFCDVEEDIL